MCSSIAWIVLHLKNQVTNSDKGKHKIIHAVATDPQTDLVIKSISNETTGFKTTQDIIRETNLPLKTINKAIDWLLMNRVVYK